MMSEKQGQYFGAKCWKQGLNVHETIAEAAKELDIDELSNDPLTWPPFVHGAEEAWQDRNLAYLDEQAKLQELKKA